MNYKEAGFRAVYRQFCVFPMSGPVRLRMWDFPETKNADSLLCYGYIDEEGKLAAEILCAAFREVSEEEEITYRFAEGSDAESAQLSWDVIRETEFTVIDDSAHVLRNRFREKLKTLRKYDASPEIEKARALPFLDESRSPDCVDDVLVYLIKDGFEPEGHRVKITGLGDHSMEGILLESPYQDFGIHAGEKVTFFVKKTDKGEFLCYTDLTSAMKLSEEDLADGSLLRSAIHIFNGARSEIHFLHVLEYLRDSTVLVPCTVVMGENDQAEMERRVKEAMESGNPESLKGMTFTTSEVTRMVPDILTSGEEFFFPVFSGESEPGEYGTHFSMIPVSFLKAIRMARANERQLKGIVVDAFSEPFVLDERLYSAVEGMKSRLE